MDSLLRGTLQMIFIFFVQPHLTLLTTVVCPSSCKCDSEGDVICVGYNITDIPKKMPVPTNRLQLSNTNMNVINEQSLADLNFTRFSLTHSHLHTIHPRAFHAAPQLLSVKLSSNDLSSLPAQVFSSLTSLEQLYLDQNQLETISLDMLDGLAGLQILDLNRNKLTSLAPDIFSGLTNLTFLNIGRNSIKKLPPTIFHSLTNLRKLMMYNNELELLESGIFDELVNLEELKIYQNQIASLPPKVFWSLRNLRTLTLSSNQLQTVPEKSFYNMPKLSKLTLYNNPLLSLPDEVMGHMPYITEFYLYGTNLTTVPGNLFANMSGLLNLNFHLNKKLRELPSDLFCCLPNLQKLSLRSNDLQYLHPHLFSKLNMLAMLLLNDNKLQSLPESIFQDLPGIASIDLKNNHLKTLPGDIFSANRGLRVLSLSGNPWDCTCSIRGIAKWIRHNEHVVQDREDVMCHSPMFQLLRTLASLRDDEFNFCDATEVTSNNPTQITEASTMHKVQTMKYMSTSRPSSTQASTTAPTTAASTTPAAPSPTTKFLATIPSTTPSLISDAEPATTLSTSSSSFHTPTSALPHKELLSVSETPSAHHWSPPFYDKLVVEQRPEFVHHNRQKGWVYVWFLPSDAGWTGFLMICHILLVATGLFLILATMYGMYRLNKTIEGLNAECAHLLG